MSNLECSILAPEEVRVMHRPTVPWQAILLTTVATLCCGLPCDRRTNAVLHDDGAGTNGSGREGRRIRTRQLDRTFDWWWASDLSVRANRSGCGRGCPGFDKAPSRVRRHVNSFGGCSFARTNRKSVVRRRTGYRDVRPAGSRTISLRLYPQDLRRCSDRDR